MKPVVGRGVKTLKQIFFWKKYGENKPVILLMVLILIIHCRNYNIQ